jgi:hypothetical protein
MAKLLTYLWTIFVLVSCQTTVLDLSMEHDALSSERKISASQPYTVPTLAHSTFENEWGNDDETLFGKFFNDRIAFHIIENPDLQIQGVSVDKLTLYFIDDVLCKKKYELKSNISNQLMNQFGSFKFKALNHDTKEFAVNNGVVIYYSDGKEINPALTHFQMKWLSNDKTIIFRHQKDSMMEENYYTEELPEFLKRYRLVDNS